MVSECGLIIAMFHKATLVATTEVMKYAGIVAYDVGLVTIAAIRAVDWLLWRD